MPDSFIKLIIGDLDKKREYKKLMKRVNALPEDYKYAFRKVQQYMYRVGAVDGDMGKFTDLTMFEDIVDLFETSSAEGRRLRDVVGDDIARLSDDLIQSTIADSDNTGNLRVKINKEIKDKIVGRHDSDD
jgi:DNA-binding ferritin-like protein (Dps family)